MCAKQVKTEEQQSERVAILKRKIAATKKILKQSAANPEAPFDGPGRGNPRIVEIGRASQFKKGDNKVHGPTVTKKQIRFWRYVIEYLSMLKVEVEAMSEIDLTIAECGARKFALNVAEGKWIHTKEVIERELGRVREGTGEVDIEGPRLIKMPFKITMS